MKRKITKGMIRELCTLCTRNESGEHFVETSQYWLALEEAGLIAICRPYHPITNILYGWNDWSLEVTEAGQSMVDALTESYPH